MGVAIIRKKIFFSTKYKESLYDKTTVNKTTESSDVAKDFFGQSFSQISPKRVSHFWLF